MPLETLHKVRNSFGKGCPKQIVVKMLSNENYDTSSLTLGTNILSISWSCFVSVMNSLDDNHFPSERFSPRLQPKDASSASAFPENVLNERLKSLWIHTIIMAKG